MVVFLGLKVMSLGWWLGGTVPGCALFEKPSWVQLLPREGIGTARVKKHFWDEAFRNEKTEVSPSSSSVSRSLLASFTGRTRQLAGKGMVPSKGQVAPETVMSH